LSKAFHSPAFRFRPPLACSIRSAHRPSRCTAATRRC